MSVRRPPSAGFSVPEARGDVVPEGGRAARRGDSPPRRGRATHDADDTAPRGSRAAHDTDDTVPRGGRAAQDPGAAASQGSAPAGIRIHKAMAQAGVASRREAERLIAEGQVRVNGEAVARPGRPLIPGDRLEVRGRAVAWEVRAPPELWALYKPKRCVCTLSDPEGRRTVKDYFPRTAQRLFPVGRLDYDAEGLLLLTSDGALAQRVLHPSFGMPRVYLVKVRGIVEQETLRRLAQGVRLEGRVRQPARTRVLHTVNEKTWLEVVLREGIQHHIKKMFDAVGHPVLKIKRYRIGPIELGDLQPGKSRRLGQADMDRLTHWAETGRAATEQAATGRAATEQAATGRTHPESAGRARIAPPPEPAGAPGPGGADEVPLLRLPPAELARA